MAHDRDGARCSAAARRLARAGAIENCRLFIETQVPFELAMFLPGCCLRPCSTQRRNEITAWNVIDGLRTSSHRSDPCLIHGDESADVRINVDQGRENRGVAVTDARAFRIEGTLRIPPGGGAASLRRASDRSNSVPTSVLGGSHVRPRSAFSMSTDKSIISSCPFFVSPGGDEAAPSRHHRSP